jgi:hypothetical protein
MEEAKDEADSISRAAGRQQVSEDLLRTLLGLEKQFADLPAPRARARLSRCVAELLDEGSAAQE